MSREDKYSSVASHYNARKEMGREAREQSQILGLRRYNNWVKATLIHKYAKEGEEVLDLGCGKGGDLIKYSHARIGRYVGVDIADQSVEQAKDRHRTMRGKSFPARIFTLDCFSNPVAPLLNPHDKFDFVSAQFCIHYAFDREERVRMLLTNITERLRPGGVFVATVPDAYWIIKKLRNSPGLEFGNSIYKIRFEQKDTFPILGHKYWFELVEAIDDCAEYLVHFPSFQSLAYEYGLQLEYKSHLHEFYMEHKQDAQAMQVMERMQVCPPHGEISPDEWEAIGIYMACVFRKVQ